MIHLDLKLQLESLRKLPKDIENVLKVHPDSIKGAKAAGQAYLSLLQRRFIARSRRQQPPGGGKAWKNIGLVATILRKKGSKQKFTTFEEIKQHASFTISTLRDTNTLLNSLRGGRTKGSILIANTGLQVIVGTRDEKAEKHQKGLKSTWPGEHKLLQALDKRVRKINPGRKKSKRAKRNWNADYFILKNVLKKKALKSFKLPKRPIVEAISDVKELRIIGRQFDIGFTKAIISYERQK